MNFWEDLTQNLGRPILALAPLAGITDGPFRRICKEYGADVLYSEMVSTTALNYDSAKTLDLARFQESERPYIVQLFGNTPDHFANAVKVFDKEINPDGYDINFGCPVKKVLKQGAGAALFQDLALSREVIKSAIGNTDKPVSIKIRSQAGQVYASDFLKNIEDLKIEALMIHGRTLAQGFGGGLEAIDFETMKNARNYFGGVLLANGAIMKWQDAYEMIEKTGADGVGLGQGVLGRPWLFQEVLEKGEKGNKGENGFQRDIFEIALRHAEMMFEEKGEAGLLEMRKHLAWYVSGLPGAKDLRVQLIQIKTINDIRRIFSEFRAK